ncbi:exportin-1 [Neoconidiobolus thromboides FSU 785]|nr:exportin-1 [Neoconidiobolus thromboides FSU 785]
MDQIEALFDFNSPFNPNLLDEIVNKAYTGRGIEQKNCMEALNRYQHHPEAWNLVDQILERCQLPQTKFIGLAILEKFIQTRWKSINPSQKEAIKKFAINLLLKDASTEAQLQAHKLYLKKLNLTIVELLKQEWPHNWPTFIPDLITSSRGNLSICENNMQILRYLSEEIYDFSEESLTQNKIRYLKHQMEEEFQQVFQLCLDVLAKAQTPGLVNSTLETLSRFLNWIPLDFVFNSDLLNILVSRFLPEVQFRNLTLKCITQVVCQPAPPVHSEKLLLLVNLVFEGLKSLIPSHIDLAAVYDGLPNNDQEYVQNVTMFFTGFFEKHLLMAEQLGNKDTLLEIHSYLVRITLVDERELFKICLEYWHLLLTGLFNEMKNVQAPDAPLLNLGTEVGGNGDVPNKTLRKDIYAMTIPALRRAMIETMVKPEEVLIIENEYGEVVRETQKETDTIALYKTMRECLVYLTHLDVVDTEQVMLSSLHFMFNEGCWDKTKLNKLCWSIGSISGAMHSEMEKKFLVSVVRDLLTLCEVKKGKDNKAIVASNIMYTVGQYPRFLRNHWKFLRTVVNKLFEFMHESHEGVQDMACDTFDTVAQSCKKYFVVSHPPDDQIPYIHKIINDLPRIIDELTPVQRVSVYESIGHMIASDENIENQVAMIEALLNDTNQIWVQLITDANILEDNEKVKNMGYCLKTFSAVCKSVGPGFSRQLSILFPSLLNIYKTCSRLIDVCIDSQGAVAVRTPKVKNLRIVRKETLILLDVYISNSTNKEFVLLELVPNLIDTYLLSYRESNPLSKEPEVLDLFGSCAEQLGSALNGKVADIFNHILQCTIEMISHELTNYPEIRISFYKLLHKLITYCFEGVIGAPGNLFDLFMLTITYGFKHTMRDISETALSLSNEIFKRVLQGDPSVANSFYQAFALTHISEAVYILFDTQHKNGFHSQCILLSTLLHIVESNQISCDLNFPNFQRQPDIRTNSSYMQSFLVALISNTFSHLSPNAVTTFVQGMQLYSGDLHKFKLHVRDFLISLKEFGNDNADLYLADREIALEAKKKQEREVALQVPGMIKPSELPPGMED